MEELNKHLIERMQSSVNKKGDIDFLEKRIVDQNAKIRNLADLTTNLT
jgi:hypothetical protein